MSFIVEEMDYMDKVRNKYNGTVGRVIAIYMDHIDGVLKTF